MKKIETTYSGLGTYTHEAGGLIYWTSVEYFGTDENDYKDHKIKYGVYLHKEVYAVTLPAEERLLYSEWIEEIKASIVAFLNGDPEPKKSSTYGYALVRTGDYPNYHYFPLPLLFEKVKAGTADRWMRRRAAEIKKALGIEIE